jgi:DNA-binding transcriptional LysR family regulator
VSQPAVSKTIADMEHTFGVRLLDRKAQGIQPTVYGEALLRRGDALFEDLRAAVQEIASLADPAAGEVRVGASAAVMDGLLPIAIDRFSRQYPKVAFVLTGLTSPMGPLLEDLRRRKLDVAVGRMPLKLVGEDLQGEVLFGEPLFVVTAPSNPLARRKRIKLADLLDQAWILPEQDTAPGAFIADVFRASGLEFPRKIVSINDLGFSTTMIETGRFFGMFPGSYLYFNAKRSALKVLPIKLPLEPPPVVMTTVRNRTVRPAVELFMECVREVARPLARNKARRR